MSCDNCDKDKSACSSCSEGSCSGCGENKLSDQDKLINSFLARVKRKLVVMSGKGGVGKSTVAADLAYILSRKGKKVGLLDVDLHGPSIAGIFGLTGIPLTADGEKLVPYQYNENLQIMTVQGLLGDNDSALIWRGPVKIGVIRQFLSDTSWDDLDFLIIDCPPGTGDEPLTVVQSIPNAEAIIVTTPQEIALADVRKSINFCHLAEMPIAGLIENMSGFLCPNCRTFHYIFKTGGGEKLAAEKGIPFLGKLPIDPAIVESEDAGTPMEKLSVTTLGALGKIADKLVEE